MTKKEAKIIIQQTKRITEILNQKKIEFRFYTPRGFIYSTWDFIGFIERNYDETNLSRQECELDILGLGCDTDGKWERRYFEDWSITIDWLLDREFQEEFEHVLSLKRIKSLFQ
jgi:hypothetical protein